MEDLSFFDKLGAKFDNNMTNFFTWWGTLAAKYPLPVIVLSIAFAVGLSSGMVYLAVTTDPIELDITGLYTNETQSTHPGAPSFLIKIKMVDPNGQPFNFF